MKKLGEFKVKSVVDGDTIKVDRPPLPDITSKKSLRLLNIDTEETTNAKFLGPVTDYGKEVSKRARNLFHEKGDKVILYSPQRAGFFNRPLVYVHFKDGTCYQEYAIKQGWTPYYNKYGWAHKDYHDSFLFAQEHARKNKLGIWSDDLMSRGNKGRPYERLFDWWSRRANSIKEARRDLDTYIVFDPEYYNMLKNSEGEYCHVFGELKCFDVEKGMFSFKVNVDERFYLYVPDRKLSREIYDEYIGEDMDMKVRYVTVSGLIEMYKGIPEIEIHSKEQLNCLRI